MLTKSNIVHQVCDTSMHILHDSYLYGSNLWPKKGFKAGWGIGSELKDCIHVGINAWGCLDIPPNGVLIFNIWDTPLKRRHMQIEHLRILFDYTIYDNLYFEDQYRKSSLNVLDDQACFKFTYTPKQ